MQSALANLTGLANVADCCDIVERFVEVASEFLQDVQSKANLSNVKWPPTSFDPDSAAR